MVIIMILMLGWLCSSLWVVFRLLILGIFMFIRMIFGFSLWVSFR